MGRSDDSITRRKNKRSKSKQEEKNQVSNRIAGIIAAKKRRLTGKRRMCQGMCYSLPTLEDPFNDRYSKTDPSKNPKKTVRSKEEKMKNENKRSISKKRSSESTRTEPRFQELKKAKLEKGINQSQQDCPSKFLIVCLNTIQKILQHDGTLTTEEDKPFFGDTWGIEFWKSYTDGKDVLETSSADARVEQIAWIASTAADTISRKEREGQSFSSPFLLYLVQSQEKATKIRKICKPLKVRGIHTVSLHQGAPIDHQIHGLKRCEPEFLVSTPDRLLELISSNAIDISGVSLLVIDGLKALSEGGFDDALESIRECISGDLQTVVFGDF